MVEPLQLQELQDIESFFIKLNPKDAYNHSAKIREYAMIFFSKGHLSHFNNIFSRYIKNMRDLSDSEMHEFIIRYFIASVIKKNYELAITDILNMRQNYIQYDMNIYIFLLKLISGNFAEAADLLLNVNQNVYEEVWKIVSESDFALYSTISLLVCFNRHILKEIQVLNQTLVYQSFEEHPENLEILENYSKCRFDFITDKLDQMQENITSEPLLANNLPKINYLVKVNILSEILKASSTVSLDYLCKLLKEKNSIIVENWILHGISEGRFKVKIDDIDKLVYSYETESLPSTVNKALDFSKKTYCNSMNKILSSLSYKNVNMSHVRVDQFKKYMFEKGKGRSNEPEY
jgi:hypothetical protein